MKQYKTTTNYTSAAASLMVVINHFNESFELSQENEFKIWLSSVNLPTRASSIYGLANFAKEQGLNPSIILKNKDYEYPDYRFKGYKKIEIEQAEFSNNLHKLKSKQLKIKKNKCKITADLIEQLVLENKTLLVRLNAGVFRETASISNYVIVKRKNGDYFEVVDSQVGLIKVSKDQIQEALDTLSSKKKRSSKILVFE